MIYLDYAADTPTDERVLAYFCEQTRQYFGNANSNHSVGKAANERMQSLTKEIGTHLGVCDAEIIVTSGASESNNMAIKGIAGAYRDKGKHIISTCLEHASVSGSLTYLQGKGYEIDLVDILPDGTVDLEHLSELLRDDTILVSICYVDSELGIEQPIREILKRIQAHPNCQFHVDATQAVGKIPISIDGIDVISMAPHKFYGINGCGLLIKKEKVALEPLIHGGMSTTRYRSGTPTVGLTASIERSLALALSELEERTRTVVEWNRYVIEKLKSYPNVVLHGRKRTLPHVITLSIKGVNATIIQEELGKKGICISTKSACSVPNTPSRAVYAITRDKKLALSSFRISLSHLTTKDELTEFLTVFEEIYQRLTKS